jgi:hypothetical protein
MRTVRLSARCLAVGAVAALALTATAAGTAVAAQPAETAQQVPTYDCWEAVATRGLVSAFDCDASAGAPTLGTINGPFVINTPSDSWTCDDGLAAVPVSVVGFGCE